MSAIVLAGVKRLGAVEGFPVTDFELVSETDLSLEEIRDRLRNHLTGSHLDVGPGKHEDSLLVTGVRGGAEALPDLGAATEE
jgi:hypothetical protein